MFAVKAVATLQCFMQVQCCDMLVVLITATAAEKIAVHCADAVA